MYMHVIDKSVAFSLYTHIYIYIYICAYCTCSDYRLFLYTLICVYMYILQSDYRLVVLWERRLAGILFAHACTYMHVLFWLKSSI